MRLGLCCTFLEAPIKFRTSTARFVSTKPIPEQREFLSRLALHNVTALESAIRYCFQHRIGAFRITSQLFPLTTHSSVGYALEDLPGWSLVARQLVVIRELSRSLDIRLSLHPDQFVVPGSATASIAASSLAELEHSAHVAELVGADQMTLHGGGAQPDKAKALQRLGAGLLRLSPRARRYLALENDDRIYTVIDLLPICDKLSVPLVYDVHHHRCNPDGLNEHEATRLAEATWHGREPWAHLSSPKGGWTGPQPRTHAEYIRPRDVPLFWLDRRMTVDIEAKAKELAVIRLQRWLESHHATAHLA